MHVYPSPTIKKVVEELKRAHKAEGERIKKMATEMKKHAKDMRKH